MPEEGIQTSKIGEEAHWSMWTSRRVADNDTNDPQVINIVITYDNIEQMNASPIKLYSVHI